MTERDGRFERRAGHVGFERLAAYHLVVKSSIYFDDIMLNLRRRSAPGGINGVEAPARRCWHDSRVEAKSFSAQTAADH